MKENKALKIIIVILLIVIALLIGWYLGTNQVNNEQKVIDNNTNDSQLTEDTKKENTNSNINEKSSNSTQKLIQILHINPGTIVVGTDGSVYWDVDKYIDIDDSILGKYGSYRIDGTYGVDEYVTGLGCDGESETGSCHDFDGYKLNIDNVSSAYYVDISQGAMAVLFVKKDGTVDLLYLGYNSKIGNEIFIERNVSENSNIISVRQNSVFDYAVIDFIDNNGIAHRFDNFFKIYNTHQ